MGFATLEKYRLCIELWFYQTGILRMFLSVPSHGAFAVLMGYHVGLAKFDKPRACHQTYGKRLSAGHLLSWRL